MYLKGTLGLKIVTLRNLATRSSFLTENDPSFSRTWRGLTVGPSSSKLVCFRRNREVHTFAECISKGVQDMLTEVGVLEVRFTPCLKNMLPYKPLRVVRGLLKIRAFRLFNGVLPRSCLEANFGSTRETLYW